jgi:kumamolisin
MSPMGDGPEERRVTLDGSEPPMLEGDRRLGSTPPDVELTISIYLKPGSEGIGAPAQDSEVAPVVSFLERRGLRVAAVEPDRRLIRAEGSVAQLEAAFGASIDAYERAGGRYVAPSGPLSVPAELADKVQAVLGLDTRPLTRGGGPPIGRSSGA